MIRRKKSNSQDEQSQEEILTAEKASAATFLMAEPRGYYHVQVDEFVRMASDSLRAWENRSLDLEQLLHEAQVEIDQLSYDNQSLRAQIEIFRVNGSPMVDEQGNYVTESQLGAAGILGAGASEMSKEVERLSAENTELLTRIAELQDQLIANGIDPLYGNQSTDWSDQQGYDQYSDQSYEAQPHSDSGYADNSYAEPVYDEYSQPEQQYEQAYSNDYDSYSDSGAYTGAEMILIPPGPEPEPAQETLAEQAPVEPVISDNPPPARGSRLFGRSKKNNSPAQPAPTPTVEPEVSAPVAEAPSEGFPQAPVTQEGGPAVFGSASLDWEASGSD